MLSIFQGLIVSYLLGSIPTAFLMGRILRKIDIRQHGSGNVGATNAFRVLGKKIGTAVLLADIAKGFAAVGLAKNLFYEPVPEISLNAYLCCSALTVVAGHNWTVFLSFKGGKGMATSLGALLAFAVLIPGFAGTLLTMLTFWCVVFLVSGYVSLASVAAAILLVPTAIFFHVPKEVIAFLGILSILAVFRHKSNIIRLLQKSENRFNTRRLFKKTP